MVLDKYNFIVEYDYPLKSFALRIVLNVNNCARSNGTLNTNSYPIESTTSWLNDDRLWARRDHFLLF